jgi:23S rRNA pseudouridine2604 synthase
MGKRETRGTSASDNGKQKKQREELSKSNHPLKNHGVSTPAKNMSPKATSNPERIIVHQDKSADIRVNKYISESGFCSRREADRLVEQGRVLINGIKAGMGDKVLPGQRVVVNGQMISAPPKMVYIAFNKPVGVTSTTDRKDKTNIIDYISHRERIFPIGRLDKDSQGLILLTNDGDIVNKILRSGNNHEKEYIVTVNKPITSEFVLKMGNGVPVLGEITHKCLVEKISDKTFRIILKQGMNRQIRRMCEFFHYEVTRLQRIRIMNIELGNLKTGQWRDLRNEELMVLNELIQQSAKE